MTRPSFDRYLAVVTDAASALTERAERVGLDVPVVTCPTWSMADLVAHQGIVHRWAASNLRRDGVTVPTRTQVRRDVPPAELVGWFTDGTQDLLAALRQVAPDVAAMVFLNDAPPPREFWARRQAHETTVHAVDALAGELGRVPLAAEVGVGTDIALDGIDELLTGFFTRGRSRIAEEQPLSVAVSPTDSELGWTMQVADGRLVTVRDRTESADATLVGTAAQLYLGLWNRGCEIESVGRPDLLDRWRRHQRVRWS